MQIVHDIDKFRQICWDWRCQGLRTGLVPTMGFLHEGHASLLRYAREDAAKVMMSLFVNPAQFGPNEDLDRYPRSFDRDRELAESLGVDLIFAPEAQTMYPKSYDTWVDVPGLGKNLCGKSRPVFFRGVSTIVTRLLVAAMPSFAVFGQKDWQQLAVVRRLAKDLGLPVDIVGRPIVREADGLAMSSRNANLNPEERSQAVAISQALALAAKVAASGERSAAALLEKAVEHLRQNAPLGEIDYLEFVHPDTIETMSQLSGPALLAAAVKFPSARLIDNMLVE
ncbi:pantoate--beta-alanine ligase [Fundidesulfovibrio butyratiphilus]